MFDFLPEDYESQKSSGDYFKMRPGEYKVRIMSKPIVGWEDWKDRQVMRFRLKDKPVPQDPKKKVKKFWAMVIWDYNESKICIWNVTQASIQRELEKLVADPDWGSPFSYDLKLKRTGGSLEDTEYFVTPLPHKELPREAIVAFQEKPIWLEALYTNSNPFEVGPNRTQMGVEEPKVKEGSISQVQYQEIMDLVYDDSEYLKKLNENVKKHFGASSVRELPASKYEAVLKSVKLHAKERAEKEENLPF